jgi:hypothetical protein
MRSLFLLLALSFFSVHARALTNSQPAVDDGLQSQIMIRTEGRTPDGDSAPDYCNATLISPRILVTAAHCVAQSWYLRDNVVEVHVGKYKFVTRPNGQVVRIGYVEYLKTSVTSKILLTAGVRNNFQSGGVMSDVPPGQDYAVVILSNPLALPANFPFRKMVPRHLLASVTSGIGGFAPMVTTVNPWEEASTTDTKRFAYLNNMQWNSSGWFESSSQSETQEGDSGSGLLVKVQGEYQLAAVVKGRASSLFSHWDVFTLAAGNVCSLSQGAGLTADELALLCR